MPHLQPTSWWYQQINIEFMNEQCFGNYCYYDYHRSGNYCYYDNHFILLIAIFNSFKHLAKTQHFNTNIRILHESTIAFHYWINCVAIYTENVIFKRWLENTHTYTVVIHVGFEMNTRTKKKRALVFISCEVANFDWVLQYGITIPLISKSSF